MRLALSVVLLACSTAALAADGNSDPSQTPAIAKPVETKSAEDGKICKRIESTESRLGAKKLCMTAKQWKEYNETNG